GSVPSRTLKPAKLRNILGEKRLLVASRPTPARPGAPDSIESRMGNVSRYANVGPNQTAPDSFLSCFTFGVGVKTAAASSIYARRFHAPRRGFRTLTREAIGVYPPVEPTLRAPSSRDTRGITTIDKQQKPGG